MLLRLSRPNDAAVARLLDEQCGEPYSYAEVGATRDETLPAGYDHGHADVTLGSGADTFAAARDAVCAWAMFDLAWMELSRPDGPPAPGVCVAPVARTLGLWSVNVARVVYLVDESRRFGFAYGTLPAHAERGEEIFLVHHDADDVVRYDVRAFSRPQLWFSRIGKPIVAARQRRFRADSCAAMRRAVTPG